jgi:flagellar basal-body rod protein FlgC
MTDLSKTLSLAASGMKAQSARLRLVSENLANTDTPGYRRKSASFEAVAGLGNKVGEVRQGQVRLDQTELPRVFNPSHPMANETGYYDGSNVNMMVEIADAREAQRSYEANLKMFEQARKMSSSLMNLLRR